MFSRTPDKNRLIVPQQLIRGARHNIVPAEQSGFELLDLARRALGLDDFAGKRILDVGCGTRLVQAILGNDIDIGAYVGLDVYKALINFLQQQVTDSRFSFHHLDLFNGLYNRNGPRIHIDFELPVPRNSFDIIWLFSVFTHFDPMDSDCMLAILRRYIEPDGKILFSFLLKDGISAFDDMEPKQPLLYAAYTEEYARHLIHRNGWEIIRFSPPVRSPSDFYLIQHHFICRPT